MQMSGLWNRYGDGNSIFKFYKSLRNRDFADCVLLATDAIKQNKSFRKLERKEKSASEALQLGIEGKKAFCLGEYQLALVNYNLALMRAPQDSEPMRLTYYSRAELLLKTKQFPACVKDIEICLALTCPDSLVNKLNEMRAEASRLAWVKAFVCNQFRNPFVEDFFKLKGPRNPDIPCATSDVEVIMESGRPKVVAARDIPVGTVVAVETAFTAATHIMNQITSCGYCFKMDFNLIPCEGCCFVMFCDKRCKDKAMQEGHNVECKIIDFVPNEVKLAVKTTLKIRQLCNSWDEFIAASNDLGADRIKNSAFSEVFGSEKFSLLNSQCDPHFIHGALFNQSVHFANVIHCLDTQTSFLPNSPEEKRAAIRAVSRVMMHLSLHCNTVILQHYTTICTEKSTTLHKHNNTGYFPFIGNLINSCIPNSYVMGLRNSVALVTLVPVKKGAELSISYVGHWLEVNKKDTCKRAKLLYLHYRMVCRDCVICANNIISAPLNDAQDKAFKAYSKYVSRAEDDFPNNIKTYYKEMCNILLALSDAPFSKEYEKAFESFIKFLIHVTHVNFPNVIMKSYC